jgi:hypothetical protein
MSKNRTYVLLKKYWGWLIIVAVIVLAFPTKHKIEPRKLAKEDPAVICWQNALSIYTKTSIELNNQTMDRLLHNQSTIDLKIQDRRLEEQYCQQEASCIFADVTEKNHASKISAEFASCLSEEDKEQENEESATNMHHRNHNP